MISIVFLALLIRSTNQLEVENEICLFGMIDSAVAFENELLLLKGQNFYSYKLVELDTNTSAEELPERIDKEEYERLLRRLKAENDLPLEFKYKCSFSEICSLQFEQFESAVYSAPSTLHLIVRGRQRVIEFQSFEWSASDCEAWKSARCSEVPYKEFVQSNQLVNNFDQVVDIGSGERLVFKGDAFYLTTNESNAASKKPRMNGPFAIQALAPNTPRATQGIVRMLDQIWLFDGSQVATMTLKQLDDRLRLLRQSKGNANFEFLCEHRGTSRKRTSRIRANLNYYEILLLKLDQLDQVSSFQESSGFQVTSTLSVLACASTGANYAIEQTDPLDYLHCHPELYLLLALLLLVWLASLFALASLFILAKLLKKKQKSKKFKKQKSKKFNFYLVQEFHEFTESEYTSRREAYFPESELVTKL